VYKITSGFRRRPLNLLKNVKNEVEISESFISNFNKTCRGFVGYVEGSTYNLVSASYD
jgi:hypothetical protein